MSYLLTSHGTVVCRDQTTGALLQCPLLAPTGSAQPLAIGDVAPNLQAGFDNFLSNDTEALDFTFRGGPLADWRAVRAADKRSLHLHVGTKALVANPDDDQFSLSDRPLAHQAFLALSAADLGALCAILRSNWIVGSTGERIRPGQTAITSGFTLRLGATAVDLRWNLPLHIGEFPLRLNLLREGWRIERLYLYRPLVYYGAFGSDVILQQFALSLHSLCTTGRYQGDVAVLTDRPAHEIETLRPAAMQGALVVLRCDARDRTAYMAARYAVGAWPDGWSFQPLLYVDTDILFDRDVTPMLRAVAQSDRIAAPMEHSESLRTSPAVGATLLQRDNCSPRFALGFNTGTLGIPNLKQHNATLQTIARVIANHTALYGREAMPYVDQEIANYVSYLSGYFDTALITPYVRLANQLADPSGRRGLVHYCWVPGAAYRVEVMRDYLQRMSTIDGTADLPMDLAPRAAKPSILSRDEPPASPQTSNTSTGDVLADESLVHQALTFATPSYTSSPIIDLLSIGP